MRIIEEQLVHYIMRPHQCEYIAFPVFGEYFGTNLVTCIVIVFTAYDMLGTKPFSRVGVKYFY